MNDLSLQLGSAAIVNPHFSYFSTIYKGGKISAMKQSYTWLHFYHLYDLFQGSSSSHAGYSGSSASMASKLGTKTRIVHPDDHSISLVSYYFSSTTLREYYFIILEWKKQLVAVGNLEMHIFCRRFKMPPKLLRGLMWLYCHMRIITSWSYD